MERNKLIAYAMDFVSYIISKFENIDRIILYGSVARSDFDEESDIDLFIDTEKKNEKKINKILENYYNTQKFKEWKLKNIENPFSMIIDRLDNNEWKDLKRAIMNTGIILYGKYKANAEKINHYILFSFENIKPDKKRIAIFRKLFGFKIGNKEYKGLFEKINAVKIGKGAVLVPIEHANNVKKFFQEKKVPVKLYDLWSDVRIE